MRHYYSQYDTVQGRYTHQVELAFLSRVFAGLPAGSLLLDVSGGGGRLAQPLSERGLHVVITEITPAPLRHALSLGARHLSAVVVAPGPEGFAFADHAFDGAMCIQVPDLVENDASFFPVLSRVLKPGAPLVVTCTNRLSYKAVLRRLWRRGNHSPPSDTAQTRVFRFKTSTIVGRALNAGFAVSAMQGYNWPPFPKASDCGLLWWAAALERVLCLRKLPLLSPWTIVQFRRRDS